MNRHPLVDVARDWRTWLVVTLILFGAYAITLLAEALLRSPQP